MKKYLEEAIDTLGLQPASDYPTIMSIGGSSDDCHWVVASGPGGHIDKTRCDDEYKQKACTITCPDGSIIVVTCFFSDREWETHIALPAGFTVDAVDMCSP